MRVWGSVNWKDGLATPVRLLAEYSDLERPRYSLSYIVESIKDVVLPTALKTPKKAKVIPVRPEVAALEPCRSLQEHHSPVHAVMGSVAAPRVVFGQKGVRKRTSRSQTGSSSPVTNFR